MPAEHERPEGTNDHAAQETSGSVRSSPCNEQDGLEGMKRQNYLRQNYLRFFRFLHYILVKGLAKELK